MTNTIECATELIIHAGDKNSPAFSARVLLVDGQNERIEFNAVGLSSTEMFRILFYLRTMYGDQPEIIGIIKGFTNKNFTSEEVQEVLSRRGHI